MIQWQVWRLEDPYIDAACVPSRLVYEGMTLDEYKRMEMEK